MNYQGVVSYNQEQRLFFWRRPGLLILSLVFIGVLLAYYPQVTDDADIWWHLKYGQSVLHTRSWQVDHAAYSWTPADGAWVYVTWLGSLLLYGIYRLGGFAGLALLQWGIFAGVVGLYDWFLRLTRMRWTLLNVVMLFLAGIVVNPIAVYIKPELFSLLLFAATIAVFFAAKLKGQPLYWVYVPLFLIWVNIHGGFVYGIAFLGLAWCGESLAYVLNLPTRLSRAMLLQYTLAVFLSAGMIALNPYSWRYGSGILENVLGGAGHIKVISAYASFWTYLLPPPFVFRSMNAGWGLLIMAFCLAMLLRHAYLTRRYMDYTVLITNACFFAAGFFIMRVSVFFAALWLFSILYVMAASRLQVSNVVLKSGAVMAGLTAVLLLWETAAFNTYRVWFGRGLDDYVPADTVEFIRRNRVPGPLFNDYLTGGYLIWALYPEYKVFIDPRYGPYVKTGVWEAYVRLMRSGSPAVLAEVQRAYPFQSAVIDTAHCPLLADAFLASPEWRLVYFDSAAALFVKASLANGRHWEGNMNPHRFDRLTNPDMLMRVFVLYGRYHPSDAAVICDIYRHNVSRLYTCRNTQLALMRKSLFQLSPDR